MENTTDPIEQEQNQENEGQLPVDTQVLTEGVTIFNPVPGVLGETLQAWERGEAIPCAASE